MLGQRTLLLLLSLYTRFRAATAAENRGELQLLKLILWILIAAWAYEGVVEWAHYRRTFSWQRQGLNAWDYLVLHSLLSGKTLLFFAPVLLMSATLVF
jgi:hypothetical protein